MSKTALMLSAPAVSMAEGKPHWLQWGGPARDFVAPAVELSDRWPEGGPRFLWQRPLGGGHSAILADGDRLFTQFGDSQRAQVVALHSGTGETVWEHPYVVGYQSHMVEYDGPHATPLVAGVLLVTVSIDAKVHALRTRRDEIPRQIEEQVRAVARAKERLADVENRSRELRKSVDGKNLKLKDCEQKIYQKEVQLNTIICHRC